MLFLFPLVERRGQRHRNILPNGSTKKKRLLFHDANLSAARTRVDNLSVPDHPAEYVRLCSRGNGQQIYQGGFSRSR